MSYAKRDISSLIPAKRKRPEKQNIKRSELIKRAGLNANAIAKMGRKEPVSMDILEKLCKYFHCGLGDIVEYIPDEYETAFIDENK